MAADRLVPGLRVALDARQQKTFDALFSLGERGRFGRGGGWRGGPG